jgi:hypothetical protein
MATAGYAFADTQKILEGIISSCGADKVCVQNQVFENEKLSLAFKSIARTSCSVRTYQACPDNNIPLGTQRISEAVWDRLKTFLPHYESYVQHEAAYNYSKNNALLGTQLVSFLETASLIKKTPTGDATIDRTVEQLVKGIFLVNNAFISTIPQVATSSTYDDQIHNRVTPLGSYLDRTPDQLTHLVSEQLTSVTLVNTVNETTSVHSDVICATGQGRRENGQCQ